MSLTKYRKKRDFKRTSEPRGGKTKRRPAALAFVVQKHDASHLHYDFRLELDGVLKSWAVPKGPSLDPSQKRLAVEVEDHPLEYGSFEGTIPQGEYGGGTVMLWDNGTWEPLEDPHAGFRNGKLKFKLHGKKLAGEWILVRRGGPQAAKPQWLLFKTRDSAARDERKFNVAEAMPRSVTTGRDLDEIAAGEKPSKNRNGKVGKTTASVADDEVATSAANDRKQRRPKTARSRSSNRRRTRLPSKIAPQLPTLVTDAPDGDAWFHEIKFDGYRMICFADGPEVHFVTRNQLDWTAKLPELVEAIGDLKLTQTILDGEIVAFDARGRTEFQLLQNAFRDRERHSLTFMVFDLLFLRGEDLRDLPLEDRKAKLESLKLPTDRGHIRFAEHIKGNGPVVFRQAQRRGLEGIVSKRRDRPYTSGRGMDWVKTKAHQRAEFVVGGFTEPAGSRKGFGALLIGYHDGGKTLHYAGRVGTGFTDKTLSDLKPRLHSLEQSKSPFAALAAGPGRLKGTHWVRPELVAEIAFSNWTDDRLLRQPSFQGLREDKPAEAVTKDIPRETKQMMESATTKRATKPATKLAAKRSAASSPSDTATKASGDSETSIAGVRITHPDRMLFAEAGVTKRDLAQYYVDIADWILPHVVDRPLSIVRCPGGAEGPCFFQKHPGDAALKELRRVRIREKSGEEEYLVVEDVKGLIALAQIAGLEIHVWGSRRDMVERPDRIVIDLDPAPEVRWSQVIAGAVEVREFLREIGLESFVKTTGGKGLHLVVPVARKHDWQFTAEFTHSVAQAIERAAPQRYVSNMSKKKRTGKIFVDYLRNQRGATSVAAFSPRARPTAPLSMPLSWKELARTKSADQFVLPQVDKRLRELSSDPWKGFDGVHQAITASMAKHIDYLTTK